MDCSESLQEVWVITRAYIIFQVVVSIVRGSTFLIASPSQEGVHAIRNPSQPRISRDVLPKQSTWVSRSIYVAMVVTCRVCGLSWRLFRFFQNFISAHCVFFHFLKHF